jgi:hypothetical protein
MPRTQAQCVHQQQLTCAHPCLLARRAGTGIVVASLYYQGVTAKGKEGHGAKDGGTRTSCGGTSAATAGRNVGGPATVASGARDERISFGGLGQVPNRAAGRADAEAAALLADKRASA